MKGKMKRRGFLAALPAVAAIGKLWPTAKRRWETPPEPAPQPQEYVTVYTYYNRRTGEETTLVRPDGEWQVLERRSLR